MPRHRRGWAMGSHSNREERHSPVTVSMLEPALLTLLSEQARHGYTLLSELSSFGMTTIHPSVVYRTLRELEGLEWIISDWDTSQTQGPPRRMYRLTETGKDALQNWRNELEKTQGIISQLLVRSETNRKAE